MDLPERKNVRLKGYDYSQNGAYFVTICTRDRIPFFGHLVGAAHPGGPHVVLSGIGHIVDHYLTSIPSVYPRATLDCYIIMPDHVHFILSLHNKTRENGPPGCAAPTSLIKIINAFKALCSKEAKISLWQRGYYEHVLRNQADFDEAAQYISTNPTRSVDKIIYTTP